MINLKHCAVMMLFSAAVLSNAAAEETLRLSEVRSAVLTAHVDGRNAAVPQGAKMTVAPDGIVLDYVFPSGGHDACMVEFPVDLKAFRQVTVEITAEQPGHRPFIVLTDKNGEKHYFSLVNTKVIKAQTIGKAGRRKLVIPVKAGNSHPGEYFAFRWGGDDNQMIDFPVKKVMLGLNDHPDESTGSGRIVFHSITFK